ncbi:MAG: VWA domain-containing protein [Acidobacteria bacterium]|nr:VWA domain-containing protein [Acidobacteriota bacterium]
MTWHPRLRGSAYVVAGSALAALLHGQALPDPPARSAPQSSGQAAPDVMRGRTTAVLVDVFPQRDGRIVEGLGPDDFELFEDGRRQVIQSFEFVRIEPAGAPQQDPDGLREMYAAAADPRNRLIVLFLDELHTSLGGSNAIARPLVDFLHRTVGAGDLVGLTTPRMLPQDITFVRDRARLEQYLRQRSSWGQRERALTERRDPVEDSIRQCFHDRFAATSIEPWLVDDGGVERYLDDVLIERRREEQVLTALAQLVPYLGRLREARTTLVILTDGWALFQPDRHLADELARDTRFASQRTGDRFGWRSLRRMMANPALSLYQTCADELLHLAEIDDARRLREIAAAANRANVTAYPVATTGLAAFDTTVREAPAPGAGAALMTRDTSRLRNRVTSLRTLAESTDGIAVVQSNDLAGGLERIGADVSAYYLLGYSPLNQKMDGKFRRIEVKVRAAGLSVKARRGYFATRKAVPESEEERIVGTPEQVDRVATALAALSPDTRRADREAGPGSLLGAATMFRASARRAAELERVIIAEFRRQERLRVVWTLAGDADAVSARLLDRRGQPLREHIDVGVERADGPRAVWVDLALGAFAAGDYVIEMTAGRGDLREIRDVAFRVVR